eukprot:scaffold54944_cov32-Tisochrysis_lutea.AAC.2
MAHDGRGVHPCAQGPPPYRLGRGVCAEDQRDRACEQQQHRRRWPHPTSRGELRGAKRTAGFKRHEPQPRPAVGGRSRLPAPSATANDAVGTEASALHTHSTILSVYLASVRGEAWRA